MAYQRKRLIQELEEVKAERGQESIAFTEAATRMAVSAREAGHFQESERILMGVLPWVAEMNAGNHDSNRFALLLSTTLEEIGLVYFYQQRFEFAQEVIEESLELRVSELGEQHPLVARSLYLLGHIGKVYGDGEEVESMLLAAYEIYTACEELPIPDDWISCLESLGLWYLEANELQMAMGFLETGIRDSKKYFGAKSIQYASVTGVLGRVWNDCQEYLKALYWIRRGKKIYESLGLIKDPRYGAILSSLSLVLEDIGRYREAIQWSEKAIVIIRNWYGKKNTEYAQALFNHSFLLKRTGKNLEGIKCLKKVQKIYESLAEQLDLVNTNYADVLVTLGNLHIEEGYFNKGLTYLEKAEPFQEASGPKSKVNEAISCNTMGFYFDLQEKWTLAELKYLKALELVRREEEPEIKEAVYGNLVNHYFSRGRTKKAIQFAEKSVELGRKTHNEKSAEFIGMLQDLGTAFLKADIYDRAEELLLEAYHLIRKRPKEELEVRIGILSNIISLYYSSRAPKKREKFIRILEKKLKKAPVSQGMGISLRQLGTIFYNRQDYVRAEEYLNRAIEVLSKLTAGHQVHLANCFLTMGALKEDLAEFEAAVFYLKKGQRILKRHVGKYHEDYANVLNGLGSIYHEQGKTGLAQSYYEKAISIALRLGRKGEELLAYMYDNVSVLFLNKGDRVKGEEYRQKALALTRKIYGSNHMEYAICLHNLGVLQWETGQTAKGHDSLQAAKSLYEDLGLVDRTDYMITLEALSGIYEEYGKHTIALEFLRKSLLLKKKKLPASHPEILKLKGRIARIYSQEGKNAQASRLFNQVLLHLEVAGDMDFTPFVRLKWQIGEHRMRMGKYEEAKLLFLEVNTHYLSANLTHREEYLDLLEDLALAHEFCGQVKEAARYYEKCVQGMFVQIEELFPILAEEERIRYRQDLIPLFMGYASFVMDHALEVPSTVGALMDYSLLLKGLIFENYDDLLIHAQNKPAKKFRSLLRKKSQALIRRYLYREGEQKNEDFEGELMAIERAFFKSIEHVSAIKRGSELNWRHLHQLLDTTEAVVQILRVPGNQAEEFYIYIALVVTPTAAQPILIKLGPAEAFESDDCNNPGYLQQYTESREFPGRLPTKDWFLSPILKKVPETSRIYILPEGVFNEINFRSLQDSKGRFLSENIEIITLFNVRDLLPAQEGSRSEDWGNDQIILFGAPDFNNNRQHRGRDRIEPERETWTLLHDLTKDKLPPASFASINQKAATTHPTVMIYGSKATRRKLLSVKRPAILFCLTHSFLLTDTEEAEKPVKEKFFEFKRNTARKSLLRTGLVCAGANVGPEGLCNAWELMQMNLSGTDLVILGVCKSAQGEELSHEGVYGLERAFRFAGARTVLSTLWPVDQKATEVFMDVFFQNIIAGMDIWKAFRRTQSRFIAGDMGRKYQQSAYWGAFVLRGKVTLGRSRNEVESAKK